MQKTVAKKSKPQEASLKSENNKLRLANSREATKEIDKVPEKGK